MKIVVSGVVGVGKSTVTKILAKRMDYLLLEEPVKENPYLTDFYADQLRYSFSMQIWLLTERTRQLQLQTQTDNIIIDRSILEDPIFVDVLHHEDKMSIRDYHTYRNFFDDVIMSSIISKPWLKPDVIVYLRVTPENAVKRIVERGRISEQSVDFQYWVDLNFYYEKWYEKNKSLFNFLLIDTDNMSCDAICDAILKQINNKRFKKPIA